MGTLMLPCSGPTVRWVEVLILGWRPVSEQRPSSGAKRWSSFSASVRDPVCPWGPFLTTNLSVHARGCWWRANVGAFSRNAHRSCSSSKGRVLSCQQPFADGSSMQVSSELQKLGVTQQALTGDVQMRLSSCTTADGSDSHRRQPCCWRHDSRRRTRLQH